MPSSLSIHWCYKRQIIETLLVCLLCWHFQYFRLLPQHVICRVNLQPCWNKCKKTQDNLIVGKFTEWLGYCEQISLVMVMTLFSLALERVRLFTQCLLFSYATHLLYKGPMEEIMAVELFRRQKQYSWPWETSNSNFDLSCISISQ